MGHFYKERVTGYESNQLSYQFCNFSLTLFFGFFFAESMAKEKSKLQNIMTYGEDQKPMTEERRRQILRIPTPEPEKDRFDECKNIKELLIR